MCYVRPDKDAICQKVYNWWRLGFIFKQITSNVKLLWAKYLGKMHLPSMNFAGPGTNLNERLTSTGLYKDWSKPVDRVDNAAYHHDLAY